MEETINCPSCSAPLTIAPGQDEVHCGFCGAEFKIVRTDGNTDLVVQSQPGPQKEILTQQSDNVLKTVMEEASVQAETPTTPPDTSADDEITAPIPEARPLESFDATPTIVGRPEVDAAAGPFARAYDVPDTTPVPAAGPTDVFSPTGTPPATGYGQVPYNPPVQTTASRNRWLPIALAVFAVVCLLCACMAGVYLVFSFNSGGGF